MSGELTHRAAPLVEAAGIALPGAREPAFSGKHAPQASCALAGLPCRRCTGCPAFHHRSAGWKLLYAGEDRVPSPPLLPHIVMHACRTMQRLLRRPVGLGSARTAL